MNGWAGGAFFTVVIAVLAWVAIFIFEIHDKVYDKYFVRWRYYYDVDFLIPTLYGPFTCNLDRRFFEQSRNKKNKDRFISL